MSFPKKFRSLRQDLKLVKEKDFAFIKKRHIKIRSIEIPLKGSNTLSDYFITDVIKHNKLNLASFKTLNHIKGRFITEGFLLFFLKNKQVLRSIRAFEGRMIDFSEQKAVLFSKFLYEMKNMQSFDDLARFSIKKSLPQRFYQFTFPKERKLLKNEKGEKKDGDRLLKMLTPMKSVKKMEFTPHLNFARIFPAVESLEIDASFLTNLNKVNHKRLRELIISDKNTQDPINSALFSSFGNIVANFRNLRSIVLVITDREVLDLLNLITYIENTSVNMYCYIDADLTESDLEFIQSFHPHSKLRFFLKEKKSKSQRLILCHQEGSKTMNLNDTSLQNLHTFWGLERSN